jgi:murein DD-endopeptidase MepM/ murein hydrolase activator NlpD
VPSGKSEPPVAVANASAPQVVSEVEVTADPAPPPVVTSTPGARSPSLRDDRFCSPIPGGYVGGWQGDTGLDIAGDHLPVYAVAAGTLDYAERGHTLWMTAPDTPLSVRIALDAPVPWKGHRVTHVYYTHLSHLEHEQAEGAPVRRHVDKGERIGTSGIGNGVAHLHLGVLLDGLVEQDSWAGILREDEIRKLFGGYRNGELLPKPKVPDGG